MTVARRPGVALAEPEMAGEAFALFVIDKVQVHAMGIILAAGKTEILLQLETFGAVSAISRCLLHGIILAEGHFRLGFLGNQFSNSASGNRLVVVQSLQLRE
ncbi:MAG: hypothetical protein QOD84_2841 [Acidobacteriaceae bacterium]